MAVAVDKEVSGPAGSVPEDSNKSKKVDKPKEPTVSFIQLYSFADKYDYILMFFGGIGAVAHGAAMPLAIIFLGRFLNDLGSLANSSVSTLFNTYVVYTVWVGFLAFGSSWIEVAIWMHTGQRQSAKMRTKYVEALLGQDVSYFETGTGTGDIIHRISTDTLAVQDAIGEKTGHFLHHVATFIISFVVAFILQWRLAVVTLAVIPCIGVIGAVHVYHLGRFSSQTASASSEAGTIAHQAISQIRMVYSFVAEEKCLKSYSESLQKRSRLGILTGLVRGFGMGIISCVMFGSYGLLFTYGGMLVRKGQVNGGGVVSTIFIVITGSGSLALALANFSSFSKGQASAFKIFQLIRNLPSINKPDKSDLLPKTVEGTIELRNVDFSYASRPDVPVLRNFSLTIPSGKTVAIVGSSGSGKSTVVSLIERFYDPTAGQVLLDGLDVKKLNLKWLRQQIGLVSQEPSLFAATIAANIAYGKDDAHQQEIEEAAKVANAHSFIGQLPQGYETQVGERGFQLSGGQRQRLAIARAVVRNPSILLFDEATSALDTESEQVVQEALDRIMVGRTTVIVAHRLSTIRNADIIAVVERGSIVERGSHHELISKEDGVYAALVFQQELVAITEVVNSRGCNSLEGSPDSTRSRHLLSIYNGGEGGEVAHQAKKLGKAAVKGWKEPIARLVAMTKADWMYGMAAMIGSTGTGLLTLGSSFVLASVLSAYYMFDNRHMTRYLEQYSLISFGIGVSAIFTYILQDYSLGVLGERLVMRLQEMLLARIFRNELGWFDEDENNSIRLAARLGSDTEAVRTLIGDRIAVLFSSIAVLVVSFIFSVYLEWRLAIVAMCLLPTITFSVSFETGLLAKFSNAQAKAFERATAVAGEAAGNIRTVAAFSAEEKVQVRFANELEETQRKSFQLAHKVGLPYGLSQMLLFCSFAFGLWYSGKVLSSGKSSFGSVMKAYLILIMAELKAAESFTLIPELIKGGQSLALLFEMMDRETEIEPDDPAGKKVESVSGDIEMKQVTFAYPSRLDIIVLKKLSLKIDAGHSLALVGASGSGKSSIIALMERFYDPISGEVLIDGTDIKRYNLQSIRNHIALVPQEPALFATTIYENIEYGKPGASEAEVIQAAKAANAHSFISSFPEGYKTLVGERGVQLSGGQKQRVAIARAVLKDPTIFLLDEATSALDAESEKVVQGAINRLMDGRTTVIVAHRLSTIRDANSIAVVQDGVIIEQGPHAALLDKDGAYSRLIRIQHRAAI